MTSTIDTVPPPPFDILEAYAFMVWMWETYPRELVEFAQEYAAEKKPNSTSNST